MKTKLLYTILLFSLGLNLKAQDLSFEKALALTLENNYDIQMARVDEEIAENSSDLSNNGYLPTVSASANYNWTYYEGENRLITEDVSFDPNNSYNYGASVSVNYTLFDGQARKYNYLQAKGNHKLSQLQMQQVIQNTILELARVYHEAARLEENVLALEEAMEISRERYARIEYNYEYGQAKRLDVLNSKVDLNTDSINLINGIQELENLKRDLNYIMGQEIDQEIQLDRDISLGKTILQNDVLESSKSKNLQLRLAENSVDLSQYALKVSRSSWLPSLAANAGYQYAGSDNPNGAFVIGSSNTGPQAGISLSWNIFDAKNSTKVKNAKLSLASKKIEKQSLEQNVKSQAMNAYSTYSNLLFVLQAQKDNVNTAKDNYQRSEESFKLGQISSVEFRQAQLNLLNAEQALIKVKYDAKNAELQVLAVMGELVN
tara:strand:+ start:296764 stop:298062 length:1299 start_codon:yes stop_codon:yes gene_type:complete